MSPSKETGRGRDLDPEPRLVERDQELIGDLPGAITVYESEGLRAAPVDMHDGGGLISKNARYLGTPQDLLEPSQ